ncbi:ABC transporter permease [Actinomadura scrupuli]|uniref:ABC transporter permease n=1 Tax=Actinomadura scrupuli TaxID=559629 RepID=UPI003D97AD55
MRPAIAILRSERVMFTVLALMVLATSLLAASVPPALTARYDGALHDQLKGASPDLRVTTSVSGPRVAALGTEESLQALGGEWRDLVKGRLAGLTGPPAHEVTTRRLGVRYTGPDAAIVLSWNPDLQSRVRYVSGAAPHNRPSREPLFEIGMAERAARKLGLRAGDTVTLGADGQVAPRVRISGLYTPVSPADQFWTDHVTWLEAPPVPSGRDRDISLTTVVLDAAGFTALYQQTDVDLDYLWRLPVAADRLSAADAGPILSDLDEFGHGVGNRQIAGSVFQWSSQLGSVLPEFSRQLGVTKAVLLLALGGLGAAALGLLLLTCLVLIERLRVGLATMRARGASLFQLGLLTGEAIAWAALPATAAGYAAALPLTGGGSLAGAAAVACLVTLVPGAMAAWIHRRPGRAERRDLAAVRLSPRRVVLECLVLVLAVVGVVVLRRRGLAGDVPEHGTDPFLTAVPVLIAVAAGLLTLRLVPYPLRVLGRVARRARSAVPFVGIARASRQRPATAVPVIVLVLATAVAGFAATVDAGLRHAQEDSARHTVGADARVYATVINEAAAQRIRRVAGVTGTVPARFIGGATLTGEGMDGQAVTVIAIDLEAYRRLVAGAVPSVSRSPRGAAGPAALLSPSLARAARAARSRPLTVGWNGEPGLRYEQGGTIEDFATMPPGAEFAVVPYTSLGSAANTFATTVFVRGRHLDRGALLRAVMDETGTGSRLPAGAYSGVSVDTYADVHTGLAGKPLISLVQAGFGYGRWASACCGGLAILLMLTMEAESRGRTVSYLRTLGLSRGQLRRLTLVELGPMMLSAVAAGWLLGVVLPAIVGPAVDLRPYTGGWAVSYRLLDPAATMILAGGTILAGGCALAIDAAVNARRRLGGLLRMGEET